MTNDDKTLQDPQLSELYRALPDQQPGAAQDEAILAAARREAGSKPRPAFTPFGNSWRVPLALAAVLVLTIGLVQLTQQQTSLEGLVEGELARPAPTSSPPPAPLEKAAPLATPATPETTRVQVAPKKAVSETAPQAATESIDTARREQRQHEEQAGAVEFRGQPTPVDETDRQNEPLGLMDSFSAEQGVEERKLLAEAALPDPDRLLTSIQAYREDNTPDKAIPLAREMIRLFVGEHIDEAEPAKVALSDRQLQWLVDECRALRLNDEADALQRLLARRQQ